MIKKITGILLVILALSVPTFADYTLNQDIVYINKPHQVLKFNLSENTDYVEGVIKNSEDNIVGYAMHSEDSNTVTMLPTVTFEEDSKYSIELSIDNNNDGIINIKQDLVYNSTTDASVNLTLEEYIEITDNPITLLKYNEMDKLEKVAHDILFGFTNLQETIEWDVDINNDELDYVFDNYLANQKNQIRLIKLDNSDYLYKLSEEGNEWLFNGMKGIEYHVDQQDMDKLNAKYEEILGSLDLENKTNREKSEIIAIKLVELFDYNYEGVDDSTLQNQSYFSILYDKTVCSGYATAYSHLLNLEGIRSDYIYGDYINNSGQSTLHLWNKVYLSEDEIVYTDVTHMDMGNSSDPSEYDPNFLNNTSKVFEQPEKRVNLNNTVLFSTDRTH